MVGAWSGERLNNWNVKNNIFVAPWRRPRGFMRMERDVPKNIDAKARLSQPVKRTTSLSGGPWNPTGVASGCSSCSSRTAC